MSQHNREIKSSIFADLFGDDEFVGKRNFLSLYNAIHGTNLKLEETQIERKTIDQAVYRTFRNDVSMLINGRLIVFVEHQSTLNYNMPLRFLEYFVHILYGIVPSKARYRKNLFKIPTPEFYIFYNGKEDAPLEKELHLSEAFCVPQEKPYCELTVQFKNLNGIGAEKLPVIQNCDTLKEYCRFMDIIFQHLAGLNAKSEKEKIRQCYDDAIREALAKNILPDYLPRKITEVKNMFLDPYDYDTDIEVQREEAREEGAEQKAIEAAQNLLREGDSLEKIARCTGLPLEKVLELQKELAVLA